jgi:hypothetical protein
LARLVRKEYGGNTEFLVHREKMVKRERLEIKVYQGLQDYKDRKEYKVKQDRRVRRENKGFKGREVLEDSVANLARLDPKVLKEYKENLVRNVQKDSKEQS